MSWQELEDELSKLNTHLAKMEQPTLRDRFAMAALTGMLSNPRFILTGTWGSDAFAIADLCMKARTPNKSGE